MTKLKPLSPREWAAVLLVGAIVIGWLSTQPPQACDPNTTIVPKTWKVPPG